MINENNIALRNAYIHMHILKIWKDAAYYFLYIFIS